MNIKIVESRAIPAESKSFDIVIDEDIAGRIEPSAGTGERYRYHAHFTVGTAHHGLLLQGHGSSRGAALKNAVADGEEQARVAAADAAKARQLLPSLLGAVAEAGL